MKRSEEKRNKHEDSRAGSAEWVRGTAANMVIKDKVSARPKRKKKKKSEPLPKSSATRPTKISPRGTHVSGCQFLSSLPRWRPSRGRVILPSESFFETGSREQISLVFSLIVERDKESQTAEKVS